MGSMEKSQVGVRDRISALPNGVLHHVFSFLSTVYAVRTSILSKRWKDVWVSLPSLYFSNKDGLIDTASLSRFVDRVLFFRDSSDIQDFCLAFLRNRSNSNDEACDEVDFLRLDGWICTAITRNVIDVELNVDLYPYRVFELPQSIFTCKTLKVLKLWSNFITNTPTSSCFPSLKSLYVMFNHPKENSLEKLLSYFPVLEYLYVEGELGFGGGLDISVSAPKLKTLKLYIIIGQRHNLYNFCISAPKLESLYLSLNIVPNCSLVIKEHSLVKAYIEFLGTDLPDPAIALLEDFSNVKYLSLSTYDLEGDLPVFDNLNQLKLDFSDCGYSELLTKLLKSSPKLENLVIKHQFCTECSEEDSNSKDDEFDPPEVVPLCLLSHLKTITINEFRGRLHDKEVVKYLLKNGEVFYKMTISTMKISGDRQCAEGNVLWKEVLLFQRGSKTCQVEVKF